MREALERAEVDAHNSGEKEEAANAMCEAAVADRDAHEDERVSLLERVRSDARAMEAQRLEVGRLQAEVRTLEKQRNQHCAHSELLLKEKNRLAVGRCTACIPVVTLELESAWFHNPGAYKVRKWFQSLLSQMSQRVPLHRGGAAAHQAAAELRHPELPRPGVQVASPFVGGVAFVVARYPRVVVEHAAAASSRGACSGVVVSGVDVGIVVVGGGGGVSLHPVSVRGSAPAAKQDGGAAASLRRRRVAPRLPRVHADARLPQLYAQDHLLHAARDRVLPGLGCVHVRQGGAVQFLHSVA
jgi:hypothetical protein